VTQTKTADIAGFVLCVIALVSGQIAMSCWLTPGPAQNTGVVQDIGYTFTGLTVALSFILWRWGRLENAASSANPVKPPVPSMPRYWLTKMAQAALAAIPMLLGCLYFHMAGRHTERHSRSFAAIPPLIYLLTLRLRRNNLSDRL